MNKIFESTTQFRVRRSSEMSFVRIHSICKKCTPSQIMSYQSALNLHRVINEIPELWTTEHAALTLNIICTRRQCMFEIFKSNRNKIGMNTISNKFFHISKLTSLDFLNLGFVHFKKLMKFQFLKNGRS